MGYHITKQEQYIIFVLCVLMLSMSIMIFILYKETVVPYGSFVNNKQKSKSIQQKCEGTKL